MTQPADIIPPAAPAAEPPAGETPAAKPPTLDERRAKLRAVANGERVKLTGRREERSRVAQLEADIARRDTELATTRGEREAAARRIAEIEEEAKDPLAFLHKRGVKADEIGKRIIEAGSPEAVNAELRTKLEKIEADAKRDREEYADRIKKAEGQRAYETARRALLDDFDGAKSRLTTLAKFTPERLEREFIETYKTIDAHPETRGQAHTYSNTEILEAMHARRLLDLEESLDAIDSGELEKHLTRRKPKVKTEETASPASATQGTDSARPAKTLTNSMASSTSDDLPADFDKLSDKEQNRLLGDLYRKRAKKD